MQPDLTREEQMFFMGLLIAGAAIVAVFDIALLLAYAVRGQRVGVQPLFSPRWSLVDVWIAAHIFVAAMVAMILVEMMILVMMYGPEAIEHLKFTSMNAAVVVAFVGQNVLMFGIPLLYITGKYNLRLHHIGFRWPPLRSDIKKGIVFGLGMMVVSAAFQLALGFILQLTIGPERTEDLKELTSKLTAEGFLKDNPGPAVFFTLLIVAGVLAPFAEELFFRGFLYNSAKHRLGVIPGIILSSLIFAIIHIGPLAVVGIIPMGILLALAYEKTGSLWVPIMMHATNNILAVTLTFLMPELGI